MTLLSILPSSIPPEYRFLDPYIRTLTAPPRAAIVHQATNRVEFLTLFSMDTLKTCRERKEYPGLISFWGGVMAEAVNGMLDKMRSGRRSIQMQNDQTLLQQIVPILGEALVMKEVPGLQIASYMIVTIVASKASLDDNAITAFMDQIVHGWTPETFRPGMVCLSILSQYRSAKQLSGRVTKALVKASNLVQTLQDISQTYRVDRLANGLAIALVDRLAKKGDVRSLPIINELLTGKFLREKQIKVIYKTLLVAAHKITDEVDADGHIRKELGVTLIALSQAGGEVGDAIRNAIEEVDFDIEELELRLETAIRPKIVIEPVEEESETMDVDVSASEKQEQEKAAFERLAKLPTPKASCLVQEPSDVFEQLSAFFLSSAANEEGLQRFDAAPVLSRPTAPTKTFYFSFYMRVWSGSFPTLAKAAALDRVRLRLKEQDCAGKDFQAIIPYCIVALADPSKRVRRCAADLMAVLGQLYNNASKPVTAVWGAKDVYGKTTGTLASLDPGSSKSLIESVLLPSLEEFILHEEQISVALATALESSNDNKTGEKKPALSRSARLSVLKFLSSHIEKTPLLAVKLRLLKPVNQIRSISGTSRTDLLLPLLQWWAGQSDAEARRLVARESLDQSTIDSAFAEMVAASSAIGVQFLLDLVKEPQLAQRSGLVDAIFTRIRKVWPTIKSDVQFSTAQTLLALSQSSSADMSSVSLEAADVLRKVDLSTDVLLNFLDSMQDEVKAATETPVTKRRRVSAAERPRDLGAQSSVDYKETIGRITFILELVQESSPQTHPELLPSLFTALSDLQHLRALVGSELGYLQNMVLSSLLAMIPAYQNNKALTIDASVGNGDILASCIQRSTSPTVINAALLLVASLAKTAPDVVLHSVMPIFTFMGSSVLRQADDYSAHVVNQTVKEVIPPLIETFRKTRRNLVASTAELLSSFVVAYEHIPSHRRQDLFVSLVENLGPEDFLFAILAMFVDKYGASDSMVQFTVQIMSSFSVEVQLQTLIKLLDLTGDIFKPKPALSSVILGKNETGDQDPAKTAAKQLALLPHLLDNRRLKREITQLAERDDMDSARIRDLYATLLENLLGLATTLRARKPLHNRCADALYNLLNLLSITEFIKSVEMLLDRPNVELRQKVLRSLEMRVDKESIADVQSRAALLAFLPQLTAVIRESDDMNYKHTAVTCVDKIAEKYGKKDLEAVAAAATTIAGDHCLGQSSQSLRIMALLCLASLVDVLQDGIVPVLPVAIPKTLGYLQQSLEGEKPNAELHNAAFAFMTALAQHVPYMISGAYLGQLLACSNASAAAGLDNVSNQNRLDCMHFLAKLVDAKALFVALEANWPKAVDCGFQVRQFEPLI